MNDAQTPMEEMENEIARMKKLLADYEKMMAVHPVELDNPKKGEYCRNRRARMQYKCRRDELVARLAELLLRPVISLSTEEFAEPQGNGIDVRGE